MPQIGYIRRYSRFSVLAGFAFLFFILFLQPANPSTFVASLLRFAEPSWLLNASGIASLMCWVALAMIAGGSAGIYYARAKTHAEMNSFLNPSASACQDNGEENWMFI